MYGRWMALICLGLSVVTWAEDAPKGRLRSGEVTLLDRRKHGSYEKATFSFEHGIRDDPGLRITRNDWDILFDGGKFRVNTVTDDRSRIADVGAKEFAEIDKLPTLPAYDTDPLGMIDAVEGHVYFVHTKDSESDHIALFRVRRLVPNDRVEIEWVRWVPDPPERPLPLDAATRTRLSRLLDSVRVAERTAQRKRTGILTDPETIRLQIRTGAQGGNPSRLSLARDTYRLPDRPSPRPLDFRASPSSRDEPTWYWQGGHVPEDKALVVDAVDVFVQAPGDSNGHGEAVVVVGSSRLVQLRDSDGPYRIWFEGRALIRPGDEKSLCVEVANSSAIDVHVIGHFVPLAEAKDVALEPFAPARAPERIERVGEGVVRVQRWVLDRPEVILQLTAGAGGGNPNTINMLRRASMYVDRVSSVPLSFEKEVTMRDPAVAYCAGGRIPAGKIFRIQRIEYRGSARGDTNGHGEFVLRVGDQVIVNERDREDPIRGVWEGAIDIRPGDESKVVLEVANSSTANVRLSGQLIDAANGKAADK